MPSFHKTIVLGLDGLEFAILRPLLERGALPNMARLRARGGLSRVATTCPAQTPVAWATFATGLNPGGHGIFDFLHRNPRSYLPELAFFSYQQKSPFLPPQPVNRRRGKAIWDVLTEVGVPSVVLRCPCTYPPGKLRGRILAGMGVPDIRGSLGSSTFYTSQDGNGAHHGEAVVHVSREHGGTIHTHLLGPLHAKTRAPARLSITIDLSAGPRKARICSGGRAGQLEVEEGRWSDWLKVKFKIGPMQSARGMVRFYLVRKEPEFELYVSPCNFDPAAPLFPISSPSSYAKQLADDLGTFYTSGMIEEHDGLKNGRIDEEAFLAQCEQAYREREAMTLHELGRMREGFFFCLFDTPDRIQHMFWRFREPDHPANRAAPRSGFETVIEDHYRTCDALLGKVLEHVDDRTLLMVLSDHGFTSFRRGVHLNGWLHQQGLLALRAGTRPGSEAGEFFRHVEWRETKAYALGLSGIYVNLAGREREGIVSPHEGEALKQEIAESLSGLVDPQEKQRAVRSVVPRERLFRGPLVEDAPDLLVNFAPGYRASWTTAVGGVPAELFDDNTSRWAGDHIVDPALVPGVLMMNRPFRGEKAQLADLAPTILDALALPPCPTMEGNSLLP